MNVNEASAEELADRLSDLVYAFRTRHVWNCGAHIMLDALWNAEQLLARIGYKAPEPGAQVDRVMQLAESGWSMSETGGLLGGETGECTG